MKKLDYYWHSNPKWYYKNENGIIEICEDAPKEARESYEHYLEQLKGDFA